jgi:hypothetical protein
LKPGMRSGRWAFLPSSRAAAVALARSMSAWSANSTSPTIGGASGLAIGGWDGGASSGCGFCCAARAWWGGCCCCTGGACSSCCSGCCLAAWAALASSAVRRDISSACSEQLSLMVLLGSCFWRGNAAVVRWRLAPMAGRCLLRVPWWLLAPARLAARCVFRAMVPRVLGRRGG